MHLLNNWAYNVKLGAFPLIAIVGFATYGLLSLTALLVSAKRWIRPLRRMPVRFHRGMAIVAILLATFHLLLGVSSYV